MSLDDKLAQDAPVILIIDDDPSHLRIYGWIVQGTGFRALLAEVGSGEFHLPDEPVDLVLLDYQLSGGWTAVNIAKLVRARLPKAPIILLSDVWGMPTDVAPFVQGFVRKGEPAKLVEKLHDLLDPAEVGLDGRVTEQ